MWQVTLEPRHAAMHCFVFNWTVAVKSVHTVLNSTGNRCHVCMKVPAAWMIKQAGNQAKRRLLQTAHCPLLQWAWCQRK